ncbi:MAG TPA: nuclear transport factor 2 family protein [Candidatus Dormibacteraeota bacterium]|nr:nuclear transport factor 2 family protein [Candidatus Dormibacteraeota bacterium]
MPDGSSIRDRILALELALARRDRDAIEGGYDAVLDDGFVEHGSSGRVWTRPEMLEALEGTETIPTIAIEDFEVDRIAPNVYLARYVAAGARPSDRVAVRSRRSSVWVLDGDRLRVRFHQGTALPDTPG